MGWLLTAGGSFTGRDCFLLRVLVDPSGATGGEGQAGEEAGGKGIRAVLRQESAARGKPLWKTWLFCSGENKSYLLMLSQHLNPPIVLVLFCVSVCTVWSGLLDSTCTAAQIVLVHITISHVHKCISCILINKLSANLCLRCREPSQLAKTSVVALL